jgi:MoaA/NifB/PqqE/SkfB family radical SAM enzyme
MTIPLHGLIQRANKDEASSRFFGHLSGRQRGLLGSHLLRRKIEPDRRAGLGVVFDLLQQCNLACVGCCTNAKKYTRTDISPDQHLALSTDQVITVLDKIKTYRASQLGGSVFINYGGGEPFLRHDILPILKATAERFEASSVGIDTNGTLCPPAQVEEILDQVSYLGVSLDGLESYHNAWRGTLPDGASAFARTTEFIKQVVSSPKGARKLEVSTVPTKQNLEQIPEMMRYLAELGVKRFSVHRAMQVGRYWRNPRLDKCLPSASDYLNLLIRMLEQNEKLGLDIHIHHSIESIYSTLFLGFPTYFAREMGDPDQRSSFGIDWRGRIFFDPWSIGEPFRELGSQSLLEDGVEIAGVLKDRNALILAASERKTLTKRCRACPKPCSGGSRIAAALHQLASDPSTRRRHSLPLSIVEQALDAIDPLCPLYLDG